MSKEEFSITIHWGQPMSREENPPVTYEFDTKKELEAFMLGVDEMDGWMEYVIIEE
jgi:hypothetical protein